MIKTYVAVLSANFFILALQLVGGGLVRNEAGALIHPRASLLLFAVDSLLLVKVAVQL